MFGIGTNSRVSLSSIALPAEIIIESVVTKSELLEVFDTSTMTVSYVNYYDIVHIWTFE